MKIIVVGGTGAVGGAVVKELSPRHSVIVVGHNHGDIQVDITDVRAIEKMYQAIGDFDALIATTGNVHFAPLTEMDAEKYQVGLQSKLMGQINLVLMGMKHINTGGSFTLTSGILNYDPIRYGSSAAMVNGALDGFVTSAAIEMPRSIRINAVSPTVLAESMGKYADYFRGYKPVPAAEVALAYSKSAEGGQSGKIYRVGYSFAY